MARQDEPLFSSGLLKKTFDHLSWGVVKVNREEEITYANRLMCEIAGADQLEGRKIRDLFPDHKNYLIVARQLKSRFTKQIADEYEVELTRIKDGGKVPISIIAFPDIDQQGNVIEQVAIYRDLTLEKAIDAINHHIGYLRDWKEMLEAVAQEVHKLIPFDGFYVSLYSADRQHVREFFSYAVGERPTSAVRWWYIPLFLQQLVAQTETSILDIKSLMSHPELEELRKRPEVRESFQQGLRYYLRYPVIREGKTVGNVSLMRKSEECFNEQEKQLIGKLSLRKAILMALYYEEKEDYEFRLKLTQEIGLKCNTVRAVANFLVEEIAERYQWDNISLFQVDETKGLIRLLSQRGKTKGFRLPDDHIQSIDQGILGYVHKNKIIVNIGNVKTSPEFKDIYLSLYPDGTSQLCLPIIINDRVGWLLNIEDSRENAFAEEEKKSLEFLLSVVVSKELEKLETLRDIYYEIAVQTKTPLSLAFSWLRRLKKSETGAKAEVLDKTLKQLHKLDLTFDRLILYERDKSVIPYNEVLLDIPYLMESIVNRMPTTEAGYIALESEQELPFVLGDLYQVSFCIETILSYLLRFVPEEEKINVKISQGNGYIVILISGYVPEISGEGVTSYADDIWRAYTIKEMALGTDIIKAFIECNRGRFKPKSYGDRVEFRINLSAVFQEG